MKKIIKIFASLYVIVVANFAFADEFQDAFRVKMREFNQNLPIVLDDNTTLKSVEVGNNVLQYNFVLKEGLTYEQQIHLRQSLFQNLKTNDDLLELRNREFMFLYNFVNQLDVSQFHFTFSKDDYK